MGGTFTLVAQIKVSYKLDTKLVAYQGTQDWFTTWGSTTSITLQTTQWPVEG